MINVFLSDLFVIDIQGKGHTGKKGLKDCRTYDKKEDSIIETVPITEDGRDFAENGFGKNKSLR